MNPEQIRYGTLTIGPFWLGIAILFICLFLTLRRGPDQAAVATRAITVILLGLVLLVTIVALGRLSRAACWVSVLLLPVLAFVFYMIGYDRLTGQHSDPSRYSTSKGQVVSLAERVEAWLEPVVGSFFAKRISQWIVSFAK